MDTMQVNKAVAAVLLAGIAFFLAGRVSNLLVPEHNLEKSVLKIDTQEAAAPAAAVQADEPLPVLLAKADAAEGQKATIKLGCVACHTFTDGGKNGVGPNLYNVVAHPAASHDGFTYSAALKGKGGDWSYDNLSAWLTKPGAYAAGTKMTFAGIADAKARANVIAYLRSLSPSPAPLP